MSESTLVTVAVADLNALVARAAQRWLPIEQAAAYCGIASKSVRRAVSKGELTPSRAVRGKLIFDRRQLDSWLQSQM